MNLGPVACFRKRSGQVIRSLSWRMPGVWSGVRVWVETSTWEPRIECSEQYHAVCG